MFNENMFSKVVSHQENENVIEKEKQIEELAEKISELAINKENSIGKGATAEVFISKTNPTICYKIIHSNGEYDFRNSVHGEGNLLAKAHKISKSSGVKIPKPYYSILTPGGDHFEVLVMERINGISIKDVLHGNLDVPIDFDFKDFVSKVEDFFSKLHLQKIYHRDAHWGNIMIENGTNTPCIIDFGASIEMNFASDDPYKQTNFRGNTTTFTPDEYKIRDELRVGLRKYLFQKYGNIHNL